MRLVVPGGDSLVPGLLAPNLEVAIRNTTASGEADRAAHRHVAPVAILVRDVHWAGYAGDRARWRKPLYGSTEDRGDGTVVHRTLDQELTQLAFEHGLLFPGEELHVRLPFTPQVKEAEEVVVEYALAGYAEDWEKEILVQATGGRASEGPQIVYAPATMERIALRLGVGGPALVRATSRRDAEPLPAITQSFRLRLPVSAGHGGGATGGLTRDEAARAAAAALGKGRRGFHRPWLDAWFFTVPAGRAVALRRVIDTRAAADPAALPGYRWERVQLPSMDAFAPEELGHLESGRTAMLLRPDVFGDILLVNTPAERMYYDPGATSVPPEKLWMVLERARERGIPVRLVSFDPDGLGQRRLLSAGVTVDASGRWTDPPLEIGKEEPPTPCAAGPAGAPAACE